MELRGQHGYAMAALLVALAVMAIMMTAIMPTWRQMVRRDREAELIFRGQQYARAIGLFQRKAGPGVLPPNLDVLVDQKFLRKQYKDPITGDDFELLRAGATTTTATGGQAGSGPSGPSQTGTGTTGLGPAGGGTQGASTPTPVASAAAPVGGTQAGAATGGIMGVASKSKEESIRIYNGRTHYNEWQFVFVPQVQQAGQGGTAGGNGRGGPQGGQRGQGPNGQLPGPGGGFPRGGDGRGAFPPGNANPPSGRGAPPTVPAQPPRR